MKFLKKKKLTVMIAAGLAGISLSSVGFAGWVINAQTKANDNITVKFGTVTNSSYKAEILKGDAGLSELNLAFDSNKDGFGTNNVKGDGKKEDLDFKIVFKIYKVGDNMPGQEIFDAGLTSFNMVFSNYATLNSLISADGMNLINSPIKFSDTPLNISLAKDDASRNVNNADGTSATYTVEYTTEGFKVTCAYKFAWGTQFGKLNPLDCVDPDNQKAGLEKLQALTATNPVTLGIEIIPKMQ